MGLLRCARLLFRWHHCYTDLPGKKKRRLDIKRQRVTGSITFAICLAGDSFIAGAATKLAG
jgi:hypothetical protein